MKYTALIIAAAAAIISSCSGGYGLKISKPGHRGMSEEKLWRIDSVVNDAIGQGLMPGAVVSVVREDRVVYLKAFGNERPAPDTIPMTTETVFNLASLGKCAGTTLSVMQLVEKGLVLITDRVDSYIPGFINPKDPVTGEEKPIVILDLLTHASWLPDDMDNDAYLQTVLQKVTGQSFCDFVQENISDVLGISHTTCSGNTEVCSDAMDLSIIAATLIKGGVYHGKRILGKETIRLMFSFKHAVQPCISGDIFDKSCSAGHTGDTGPSIVVDMSTKTAIIILANTAQPTDKVTLCRVRSTIANIVAGSIEK